jgi:hypothetical protein
MEIKTVANNQGFVVAAGQAMKPMLNWTFGSFCPFHTSLWIFRQVFFGF